jgi:hypothetical protein
LAGKFWQTPPELKGASFTPGPEIFYCRGLDREGIITIKYVYKNTVYNSIMKRGGCLLEMGV